MIDEVTIFVPLEAAHGWRQICKVEKQTDVNTLYGSVGNLKIKQNIGGVFMYGSLAKYLNGENCTRLTRETLKTAVLKLETATGIDLNNGIVTRLAVGGSFIVRDNPASYLRLFGIMPTLTRQKFETVNGLQTIWYRTEKGAFQFCAYNKAEESKGKLPELYKGCNVLRMEYRIVRRQGIKAKFGHDLTPHDLYGEGVYRKLAVLFGEVYKTIPKTGRMVFVDKTKTITPAALTELMAEQYRQTDTESYNGYLQDLKISGVLSLANWKRIRAADRRRNKDYSMSDKNNLTEELDALVKMLVESGA
ncbi:hypothetical protein NO2_0618 [Candidatus Termititenax persephonae]|uniref:Replication-associated protein G2P N-terminal domain-containing protein n=1 Tax=Candidatus Termititenax persephonae TaxID=2218525 RepID=A0A388TFZ9_9BACT|nr:hypothetical protein NO2_0618 [Candidatus Termititenax persephonae]